MTYGFGDEVIPLELPRDRAASVRRRHPWVYASALRRPPKNLPSGTVVELRDEAGGFVARGLYSAESQIAVRLLTFEEREPVDDRLIAERIEQAVARRRHLPDQPDGDACRLVFAEADRLPGLMVDRYADWLVVQILTAGMEPRRAAVVESLAGLLRPRGIFERSDGDERRRHEGLEPVSGPVWGEPPPETIECREAGIAFAVDLRAGHKTGAYLDQRENRAAVARHAAGRRVLDAFCFTGGFGLHAAAAGAVEVVHLDSSGPALALAESNAVRNPTACRHEFRRGQVFESLRAMREAGERFDLIILDPPKFAASRKQLERARRGYHDLNLHAFRLLPPGGLLATFSCSGAVDATTFRDIIAGAAADAGREVLIREVLGQPADHPVLLNFPEGAYLTGLVVEVVA